MLVSGALTDGGHVMIDAVSGLSAAGGTLSVTSGAAASADAELPAAA